MERMMREALRRLVRIRRKRKSKEECGRELRSIHTCVSSNDLL